MIGNFNWGSWNPAAAAQAPQPFGQLSQPALEALANAPQQAQQPFSLEAGARAQAFPQQAQQAQQGMLPQQAAMMAAGQAQQAESAARQPAGSAQAYQNAAPQAQQNAQGVPFGVGGLMGYDLNQPEQGMPQQNPMMAHGGGMGQLAQVAQGMVPRMNTMNPMMSHMANQSQRPQNRWAGWDQLRGQMPNGMMGLLGNAQGSLANSPMDWPAQTEAERKLMWASTTPSNWTPRY